MNSIPPALTSALDALVEWAPDGETVTLFFNGSTDLDMARNSAIDLAEAWTDVKALPAGTVRAVGNITIRKISTDRTTLYYTATANGCLIRVTCPWGRTLLDQLAGSIYGQGDAA